MTERNDVASRITIDPSVCHGKPCIRGHRIWVSLVLSYLAGGMTIDEMLEEFPQLEREDILACIAWGARISDLDYDGFDLRVPA